MADPDRHSGPAPAPDPDLYPFQFNVKLTLISKSVQNNENYDTYNADEKDETMKTGTAVNKSKIISDFLT